MPARRFARIARGLGALALAGAAPLAAQDPYSPTDVAPGRIALSGRVDIPLLLLGTPPAVLPVVEVMINGRGPFRLGVETGAGFVGMHPRLIDSLGLARSGGSDELPGYRLDSLRIGGARFDRVPVYAVRTAATDIDGFLGLPLFAELLLTVDYPRQVLRLERGRLPAADGRTILPLTRVGPFWAMPLTVSGAARPAVIDTRSTGGFGFTSDSGLRFSEPPRVVGMARGAAIAPVEVRAGRLADTVALGRWRFPTPSVGIRPLPPGFPTEAIVGTLALQQFALTLDQQQRRVRLARDGTDSVIALPERAPPRQVAGPGGAPTAPGATGAAADSLRPLAGSYGVRTVTAEGDALYLQRVGGPRLRLLPADSANLYRLAEVPTARIRFVRGPDGRAHTLEVLNPAGEWERTARDP